ncbi:GTPase ObgE [Acetobacteraceae bacterium]|nr:GTPase ObgE [Candidatus Parcubacteria bacterium]
MALVDELTISARAGNGGDGVVRWLHQKGKEFSGPAGGNGGDGGDLYIRAVRDINLLSRYRGEKKFHAGDGDPGAGESMHGAKGKDMIIDLPRGSLIYNEETRERYELTEEGEQKLILKGGRGGAGNEVFKSSVNRSPMQSTPGGKGEEARLRIELRLIADIGLVGLPNAGKTSLLNSLTGAIAKVGSYAFTTLDPNLGMLYGLVIADIPGLIEGASLGKGLGSKFLRHIARTKLFVHCVSLEEEDYIANYETVRAELSRFEEGILKDKPEIILLTKSDTRDAAYIKKVKADFKKKYKKDPEVVSVLDDALIKKLQDTLVGLSNPRP